MQNVLSGVLVVKWFKEIEIVAVFSALEEVFQIALICILQ